MSTLAMPPDEEAECRERCDYGFGWRGYPENAVPCWVCKGWGAVDAFKRYRSGKVGHYYARCYDCGKSLLQLVMERRISWPMYYSIKAAVARNLNEKMVSGS